ncbi:biotin/lipoyl-binding protein [Scytonema sp. UIC 10036]|uniref:HlyD family efflux transporter periplasmic adaptor subunit n=1 Tax=Scytonema sp. UIC 10036 TaxID=2304196 RepID=UPI0012DA84FA|nr:HlyD family efflux transporter periplasmic adaptor subunit [Scytonema sp. UIC 10036]MUG95744.1 biotin/lipoyl-binding protein [Scytonema sp. UIC 10036]
MREHSSKVEGSSPLKPFLRPPAFLVLLATVIVGGLSLHKFQKFQSNTAASLSQQTIVPEIKTVTALGRLEPKGEVVKLSAPASAEGSRVEQLLVREGTMVQQGQLIAILDSRDRLAAALSEAQEQVRVAQANLAQVKAGAKQGEIEAQKATVARIQVERETEVEAQKANVARIQAEKDTAMEAQKATIARLEAEKQTETEAQKATIAQFQAQQDNAQAEFQRYQKLYEQGAIAISLLDNKRLALATAQQQVAQAKANLKRIEASRNQQLTEARANLKRIEAAGEQQLAEARANLKRIETSRNQQIKESRATLDRISEVRAVDVATAQAEVNRAIAAVKRAEANLKQAFVRSPQDGQVLKIHSRPGEVVSNEGIAEMGQTSQMYAVVEVYQSDIKKVRTGKKVRLTSESMPDELQGIVERVGWQVQRQNVVNSDPTSNIDARVVEVHVRLDETSSRKAAQFSNLQVTAMIDL